ENSLNESSVKQTPSRSRTVHKIQMAALEQIEEICPNCGEFTNVLVDFTGFCRNCSNAIDRCVLCGQSNGDSRHTLCRKHRRELWLTKNADAIERYMVMGLTFKEAKDKVKKDNGTKYDCLCCGGHVKATIFCTKTARCRAARERLRYMTNKKGVTRELALKTILESL
ncbi:MAG TPA: hypothetical protein VEP90_12860, partial [Methylomirabilota bacterium]|nr:hypothetical protein [Methylomirabilota bacterium]